MSNLLITITERPDKGDYTAICTWGGFDIGLVFKEKEQVGDKAEALYQFIRDFVLRGIYYGVLGNDLRPPDSYSVGWGK